MGLEQKKVGIIGCGLIGYKRALSLDDNSKISIFCDIELSKAKKLSKIFGGEVTTKWEEVVKSPNVDILIVSTTHNLLSEIALAGVMARKPVLVEKPGACITKDLDQVINNSHKNNTPVHVGFNHRFHPAMIKAKEKIEKGQLGKLYFIRGRYGHGGRIGYDKEWRANFKLSGGGELLDQGAHLIDLSFWYFDEKFSQIDGEIETFYWNMDVEDNAFLTLKTDSGKIAHLHASWTEWKNLFSFEIIGEKGKLQIDGLGGSYGTERLTFHKMKPEMGPPETKIWEWPGNDLSWKKEWMYFIDEIKKGKIDCNPGLNSTREVIEVIENLYRKKNI